MAEVPAEAKQIHMKGFSNLYNIHAYRTSKAFRYFVISSLGNFHFGYNSIVTLGFSILHCSFGQYMHVSCILISLSIIPEYNKRTTFFSMHVSNEWEILITKRINYCVSKFIQLIQVTQTYLILQLTNNFALLLIFSPKIYFFLNLNLKQFRQIFFC